ncbi:MAG: leucine-rich repeat protein [Odoribacteraceae bacterium]|jgi:hypothetical protein|nr:leucine-rich repeat protein [Odoribacteraceae bacterium]
MIALVACVDDVGGINPEKRVEGDGTALVTLSLTVPTSRSRGLTEEQEQEIDRVDVLLFKGEKLRYRAVGTDVAAGASATRSFTVKLPVGVGYHAVILANVAEGDNPLDGYPVASLLDPATAKTRAEVINALAKEMEDPPRKWTEEFNYIPMWGYVDGLDVTDTPPADPPKISLTRMIARVDVFVGTDKEPAVRDKFELTRVYLYNYSRAGSIAPLVDGTGYSVAQWKDGKAAAPHLPGLTNLKVTGPLEYVVDPAYKHAFAREIYAFEAPAGAIPPGNGWKENACLVIGGSYEGGEESFYRVEFLKKGALEPLALLRNHCYDVVIKQVKGRGYSSEGEAYASLPWNIDAEITERNDDGLNDIVFNDYYLAVDKNALSFYKEGNPKSLRALTDNPGGWTVDANALPEWLHVAEPLVDGKVSAAADRVVALILTADPLAPGKPSRSCTFDIVAGVLRKTIAVAQSADEELSLEVYPSELLFYRTPTEQALALTAYFPDDDAYECTFSAPDFAWDIFPPNASAVHGAASYSFKPARNNTGKTITGTLLVSLAGPSGQGVTRAIPVRQLASELGLTAATANPYPAQAGTYAFDATSEITWKLSTDQKWITLETSENDPSYHPPALPSYHYEFGLWDNTQSFLPRSATINVASDNPRFPSLPSFEIVQSGTPPALAITPGTIELSASTGPLPVTLSTNAPWRFTVDDAYRSVVGSESVPPDATQNADRTTPAPVLPEQISFTPRIYSDEHYVGEVSAVVTFFTDVPGAENASQTLTINFKDKRTYKFSEDFSVLTIFPYFHEKYESKNLLALNAGVISELSAHASDVKTLVLEGDSTVVTRSLMVRLQNIRKDILPSLVNISLPQFNGIVSSYTFAKLGWLESVNIPGAIGVRGQAFNECENLLSVYFPLVTAIESNTFLKCENLSKVSFPLVTSIGNEAFKGCTKLIEADLPNAWEFGAQAFSGVSSEFRLKINSPAGEVTFEDDTFGASGATNTMTLYLGAGVSPNRPGNLGIATEWNKLQWNKVEEYE